MGAAAGILGVPVGGEVGGGEGGLLRGREGRDEGRGFQPLWLGAGLGEERGGM